MPAGFEALIADNLDIRHPDHIEIIVGRKVDGGAPALRFGDPRVNWPLQTTRRASPMWIIKDPH